MSQIEDYDLEKIYDEKISPLMERIIKVCKEHNMPMVATFQYAYDQERQDAQCTTILAPNNRTGKRLDKVVEAARPPSPFTLAITESTNENGSKKVNIKRIS